MSVKFKASGTLYSGINFLYIATAMPLAATMFEFWASLKTNFIAPAIETDTPWQVAKLFGVTFSLRWNQKNYPKHYFCKKQ